MKIQRRWVDTLGHSGWEYRWVDGAKQGNGFATRAEAVADYNRTRHAGVRKDNRDWQDV